MTSKDCEAWILDWLSRNTCADCLAEQFHEEFYHRFGGKRKETHWGAQPVAKAMRTLSNLAKKGKVEVRRVSLGSNWQPGFPKHCKSYSLAKLDTPTPHR